LGDREASTAQFAAQLILIGHEGMADQFTDRIVSLKLHNLFRTKRKRGCSLRPRLHKYTMILYKYASCSRIFFRTNSGFDPESNGLARDTRRDRKRVALRLGRRRLIRHAFFEKMAPEAEIYP
jgi:hypothetical protein